MCAINRTLTNNQPTTNRPPTDHQPTIDQGRGCSMLGTALDAFPGSCHQSRPGAGRRL